MNQPEYTIRTMTRAEIDLCIEWAAREGWNPGLNDAQAFYLADPEGFLVGLLDGEPIASISAVRYGPDFGFIGFYLVTPHHRGKGYGLAIWRAAMARLQGRLIGLDGVVAQQANYQRSGFELAYKNIRYQKASEPIQTDSAGDPVGLRDVSLTELFAYDRRCFPRQREAFLEYWIQQPGSYAKAILINGVLRGFGVLRACRAGYKIGPLFADDEMIALQLYAALTAEVEPGAQIQFDIPDQNPQALSLVRYLGMEPVFETARMYTGCAPALDMHRMFGVTTFELG